MSLQIDKAKADLLANPGGIIAMIVENNPKEVASRLANLYSRRVNKDDVEAICAEIADLIELHPENTQNILIDLLRVDVIDENLNDVGQQIVLDFMVASDQKSGGSNQYRNTILEDNVGSELGLDPVGSDATGLSSEPDNPDNSFNWGGVLNLVLPGLLNYFGIAGTVPPGASSGAMPPPQPNNAGSSSVWIWIGLGILIFIVILWLIFRKS